MYHKIPQDLDLFNGIYLLRDGRDSLLSYYFYNIKHKGYSESWDVFFNRYYESNKYNSYREKYLLANMGNWSDNVNSYLNLNNTLIVKYENLLANPLEYAEKIFSHINISFDKYKSNLELLFKKSKEEMAQKKQRDENERKRGSFGGWQDFYSDKQNELFISRSGEVLKKFDYI